MWNLLKKKVQLPNPIKQTGSAGYCITPENPLPFNEWAKLYKVSTRDAERAISLLVDLDEYYRYQKKHWKEKDDGTQESKFSLANIGLYILGEERFPIQL